MSADQPQDPTPTFDGVLNRLENCVQRLETGQLSLEEALAVFEEGIRASKSCAQLLDQTRKRVQILVETADGDHPFAFLDATDEEAFEQEPEDDDI